MKRNLLLSLLALLLPAAGWAQTAYAVFDGESTLTFRYDANMPAENAWDVSDTGHNYPGWSSWTTTTVVNSSVTQVVFEPSFAQARPVSCAYWFEQMPNLESINGLAYLNTGEVTDMNHMFNGCKKLALLDLSNFDTRNVLSMSEMFKGCSSLKELDLSSFNTDNLKSCKTIFEGCTSLESVNLSSFNTIGLTDLRYWFHGCGSLKSLDLRSFNTVNVTRTDYMFSGCRSLEYILVGEQWNMDKVTKSDNMFMSCSSLEGEYGNWVGKTYINGVWLDADKTYAYVGEDGYLRSTPPVETAKKAYAQYDGAGTLTFKYDENMPTQNAWMATSTKGVCPWADIKQFVTKVVIEPSFANARPNGCAGWFNMTKLTALEGIKYLNTSRVRSMSQMFFNCSLTELDFSGFDTRKVKNMYEMFYQSRFTSLDLGNFNAPEVADVEAMCGACKAKTINLSNFNSEKVTSARIMFHQCKNLKRLDISGLNTAMVENMWCMFQNCDSLEYILIGPKWNTDAATNSYSMFDNCKSLTGQDGTKVGEITDKTFAHAGAGGYLREVDMKMYATYNNDGTLYFRYDKNMPSENAWEVDDTGNTFTAWSSLSNEITNVVIDPSFAQARPRSCYTWFRNMKEVESIHGLKYLNTSEMTNMFSLFFSCSNLKSLDLSHFDTKKVTNMGLMFKSCSSLKELDLSSFDTWEVRNTGGMFWDCTNLESIYISDKWNLWRVTASSSSVMFEGCTSLVGEYGATVGSKTDKTYAHAKENGYLKMKTTDGIETVMLNSHDNNGTAVWYDLQGRRLVSKPSKPGLYVNNGRKVVIK